MYRTLKKKTTDCEISQWIKVSKTLSNFEQGLYIAAVYLPPRSSPYCNIDMFNQLEDDMLRFGIDDNLFLLCGDFNSQVGVNSDIVEIDDVISENVGLKAEIYDHYNTREIFENLNVRLMTANQDKMKIDEYGRRLLELCHRPRVCFLNGRLGDDENVGKVTTTHDTVVDYMIGSPKLFQYAGSFVIEEYDVIFSDTHAVMKISLNANFSQGFDNLDEDNPTCKLKNDEPQIANGNQQNNMNMWKILI